MQYLRAVIFILYSSNFKNLKSFHAMDQLTNVPFVIFTCTEPEYFLCTVDLFNSYLQSNPA